MDSRSPIIVLGLMAGLILSGTVGYRLIEGWNWLDCLFMTVMTLTTVGYGSPEPLSTAGKEFSVVLMLLGIGLMLYLLTLLAEALLRSLTDPARQQRRREKEMQKLSEHVVVCGYGQVGEAVCAALQTAGRAVLVIDSQPERLHWAETHGIYTVEGDATDEDVLRRAGIERAASLVSALNSDPSNLYVVLSARGLNAALQVITRASDESAARKMRRAGADEVINPYQLSGNRIAGMMLAPHLHRFLSGSAASEHFMVREVTLPPQRAGQTIEQLGRETGVLVVAVWRDGHPLRPSARETVQPGDVLLLVGEPSEVAAL